MKKLFSVALIAIMMFTVSCDFGQSDKTNEKVGITLLNDNLINVPIEGGEYEIYYILKGEADKVEAKTNNPEMFDVINANSPGIVRISVTENETESPREAEIVVSYGSASFGVTVKQAAKEVVHRDVVNVEANQFVGTYYGETFGENKAHYWIILSKDGFVDGSTVLGGEYYRFDIIAPAAQDKENIVVPEGDYTFEIAEAYKQYSIVDLGNTDYSTIDADGVAWATPFVDATLKVTGNRFELVAMTETHEYHVTYEGEYKVSSYEITDYISSLTKDTVINVSNCYASVTNYGDYWKCGYNNWNLEFVCNDGWTNGTYVRVDYLTASTTDFTGTFVDSGFTVEDPTKPDFRAGVFVPGFRMSDIANDLLGSLFMIYDNGRCVSQAPLSEGTVAITANGNGTHTIVIDCYDDAPKKNKITLNWTGRIE